MNIQSAFNAILPERRCMTLFDPATGLGKTVLTETDPHFIEVHEDFRALKDGSFLWSSEKSGFNHLYRHAADGKLIAQITKGDWPVDRIEGAHLRAAEILDGMARSVVGADQFDDRGLRHGQRDLLGARAALEHDTAHGVSDLVELLDLAVGDPALFERLG